MLSPECKLAIYLFVVNLLGARTTFNRYLLGVLGTRPRDLSLETVQIGKERKETNMWPTMMGLLNVTFKI